jgi:SpoVK/Ycf46/Vps4 family AAA+-type ATPase
MLDKALLSRCDKHLLVDLPSFENRVKILDLHIGDKMK